MNEQSPQQQKNKIHSLFPTPLYIVKRGVELSTSDMEYIRLEGEKPDPQQSLHAGTPYNYDSYFFDNTKLNISIYKCC